MKTFRSLPLRVKVLSLTAEIEIIRKEEDKLTKRLQGFLPEGVRDVVYQKRSELAGHRVSVVRPATREALLAYGFLRGRAYTDMEAIRHTDPDWDAIEKMAVKHSGQQAQIIKQAFAQWKQEAGHATPARKGPRIRPSNPPMTFGGVLKVQARGVNS